MLLPRFITIGYFGAFYVLAVLLEDSVWDFYNSPAIDRPAIDLLDYGFD